MVSAAGKVYLLNVVRSGHILAYRLGEHCDNAIAASRPGKHESAKDIAKIGKAQAETSTGKDVHYFRKSPGTRLEWLRKPVGTIARRTKMTEALSLSLTVKSGLIPGNEFSSPSFASV